MWKKFRGGFLEVFDNSLIPNNLPEILGILVGVLVLSLMFLAIVGSFVGGIYFTKYLMAG